MTPTKKRVAEIQIAALANAGAVDYFVAHYQGQPLLDFSLFPRDNLGFSMNLIRG